MLRGSWAQWSQASVWAPLVALLGSFSVLLAILGLHLVFLSLLNPFLVDFWLFFNALYLENLTFSSTGSTILRVSLLYFKRRFRTLWGPFWGPLGGTLGSLGGLLAAIWGLLGVSWRCLGNVFGDSWSLLERQSAQEAPKKPPRAPRRPPGGPQRASGRPPETPQTA